MATYTTTLRRVCELLTGTTQQTVQKTVEELIQEARPHIFGELTLEGDEENKFQLAFLRNYFMWEIGSETVSQFILNVRNRFILVKEKYEKLIYSDKLSYDPLEDNNYTITHKGDYNNKSESTQNNEGNTFNLFSDTPQGQLKNVKEGKYLSAATHISNADETVNKGEGSGEDNYTDTHKGKTSAFSYAKSIAEYRNNILQLEQMFVKEFETCFMLLW